MVIVFQPHKPVTPGAMQVDPSFKRNLFCSSSYHSKIHLPEYLILDPLWHLSECNANILKEKLRRRRSYFAEKRRNQSTVEAVRSANRERVFLLSSMQNALFINQSASSNFALYVIIPNTYTSVDPQRQFQLLSEKKYP